ncbi:MAG: radical SAM protein [Candidatus Omnitrophota bacterium]
MKSSYLDAYRSGRLKNMAQKAFAMLNLCCLCPRNCRVDRLNEKAGFCLIKDKPMIYSFMPHHGEEPGISGKNGSGTIFFSGCNMRCVYCQNYEFSQKAKGREVGPEELAGIMLNLQEKGCHNINLVTPTHVMPMILKALLLAIPRGLYIPLVYNTSGYESFGILKMLEGIVDIYLVDMRYADNQAAAKYSNARDYPHYNRLAVKEMHRQISDTKINSDGIIERGIIIRHLVLPNGISHTAEIMQFIAGDISKDTYISLMSQYFPFYKAKLYPEIRRRINRPEYAKAQEAMDKNGLYNGWLQDSGDLERFAGTNIKPG